MTPRKHKKVVAEEESKELVKLSPGFWSNGQVFEQVEGGKFANGSNVDLFDEYTILGSVEHSWVYQPLNRCPWVLATKAENYGSTGELWRDVRSFIFDHLFLPNEELYDVLTAWVFASWLREVWTVVPYIFFYGPVASGKTRGLEVLQRLCYRGILASNISTAALFRSCEQWHPTLFLDETEIYSNETKAEVVGLLNSGYRKGQYAIRARQTDSGTELDVFDCFGFKALAGTRGLAQTLESRSIMVRMIKARRPVRQLIDEKRATELRNKLLEFRFFTLQCENELSELSELFLRMVPPLDFADGRLIELYSCLLAVSNEGHENILAHAKNTFEIRQMEEQATVEAELVEIMSKQGLTNEKHVVLTKEIADIFNESRSDREKWKTNSVGWKIRGLGFTKIHTGQGNGWIVDAKRLEYLKQIYGLTPPPLEKVQNVQKVHDLNEVFEELKPYVCWLCKGSLPTDLSNTTIHEGRTCHIECFRKLKDSHLDDSKNVREVKN